MFGTVGRARVKPGSKDAILQEMNDPSYAEVPGYRRSYVMFPENREGEVVIVAVFEDAASYWRNAEDPAQNERYLRLRAHLENDPEWSDGEWFEGPTGET